MRGQQVRWAKEEGKWANLMMQLELVHKLEQSEKTDALSDIQKR